MSETDVNKGERNQTERSSDIFPASMPHRPPTPEMIEIPAGPFWMGTDDSRPEMAKLKSLDLLRDELPYHRRDLLAYSISRYPVLHSQYAAFISAGGYDRQAFWTKAGWQEKQSASWMQPDSWTEAHGVNDVPVVGVSWYEAVAYCRWLSHTTGRRYRLPTEAEWEKAARGPQGNLWPWGNVWEPDRCNNEATGPGHITPAGQYSPVGDSPYQMADAVGNVWEWGTTKFGKTYPYDIEEDEWESDYLEGLSVRMLRGVSRLFKGEFARCARRDQNVSSHRDSLIGFRVVISTG